MRAVLSITLALSLSAAAVEVWIEPGTVSIPVAKILVAEFEGPDPGVWMVSEALATCLETERGAGAASFIVVERLDIPVTEDEVLEVAREHNATVVVYGSYRVVGGDCLVDPMFDIVPYDTADEVRSPDRPGMIDMGRLGIMDAILEREDDLVFVPSPLYTNYCRLILGVTAVVMGGRSGYALTLLEQASDYFTEEAEEFGPLLAEILEFSGISYMDLEMWEDAKSCFDRQIALDPADPIPLTNRGWCSKKLGDYIAANADFNRALTIDPEHQEAIYARGLLRCQMGFQTEGIQDLTDALALDPTDHRCYLNRGFAYTELEQYDRAVEDLSAAAEMVPDDISSLANLGYALYMSNRYEEAVETLEKVLQLGNTGYDTYAYLAASYASLGDLESAVTYYGASLEVAPTFHNARFYRGKALFHLGRYEEARADLEEFIRNSDDAWYVSEAQAMLDEM